ncbi:C2 domain-containing protein 5-like isoform X2 [Amphibalanus amphitrite]|uniref:C2 domain-containing protein 5-like isoform X2 n=1 Tax=Amphibalanus amphitrite TaxID=1232801 RepID=UPI001C91982E|nr:C2 domain-containing protein 5-like isoform X2 [Amphibalanus amphitrite]XP_043237811.1 C2 domain-containing protein 5-like isoform X2 [Amphibalanus amphitrite]
MPGKVKVRVLAGRNLPVMDRANDTTDAFVEIRLGTVTQKTDVCRRSLNPQWNSDWFRFEVQDDAELQDEPLQIRVMDHDTYSAHDAIGKVYLSLSPLLAPELISRADTAPAGSAGGPSVISGWIPIYDTLHGIRGEVNVMVKVDLFSDFNKFRHSSCGVQYFSSPCVPAGHCVQAMLGFVHELVVNDDPEYQWIDKIRTPRASNEARQTLFSKLSGEVQRRIGVNVIEAGGNAVIGYRQCFDLEGETGIVVRGIGTAVSLVRTEARPSSPSPLSRQPGSGRDRDSSAVEGSAAASAGLRPVPSVQLMPATPEQEQPPATPPSPRPFAAPAPAASRGILAAAHQFVKDRLSFRRRGSRRTGARALSREAFSTPNFQPVIEAAARYEKKARPAGRRRRLTSSCDGTPRRLGSLNSVSEAAGSALEDGDDDGDDSENPSEPGEDTVEDGDDDDAGDAEGDATGDDVTQNGDDGGDAERERPVMVISSSEDTASETGDEAERRSTDIPNSTLQLALDSLSAHDVVYISSMNIAASVPAVGAAGAPAAASVGASAGAPVGVPAAHTTSVEGSDSGDKLSRSLENDTNFKAPSSTTSSGADTKLLAQLVTTSAQQRGQQQDNYESAEFPFITLRTFPSGFITHIGGTVSARSVKLLDRIHHPEESETRDAWWAEVRTEVRSHCKSLACNVVLGYEEATTIWDDVCVLSAYGTAATVNFAALGLSEPLAAARCDSREVRSALRLDASLTSQALVILEEPDSSVSNCAPCHLPYSQGSAPASALQFNCAVCRKSKVPDVVFSTIEPPGGLPVTGRGCLVQARVCREKADVKSEVLAKEVSDRLPFLEYELHRQLLTKLRILGMNALFDLTIQLSIGEEIMVAVATATAVYLSALPPPVVPRVTSAVNDSADRLAETQRRITETVASNREAFNISDQDESGRTSDEESEDEEDKPELDLAAGNKDACILEMDDTEDADLLSMLMSRPPPELFDLVSTSSVPGVPERLLLDDRQLFTRIVRTKLSSASNRQLAQTVEKIIQGLYFKLRKLAPCALCGLRFSVDLPEDDEIQISVYGAALSVSAPLSKQASLRSAGAENGSADGTGEGPVGDRSAGRAGSVTGALKTQNSLWRGDYDVIITPLPHVTGGKVERWLGNLNFFFIRECTGLREVGGLNGFMQDLITEVLAVVRAHVTSLGGNALVSYFMSQCVLLPNPHKNQAQCLVNVGGDAVLVGHAARSDDG